MQELQKAAQTSPRNPDPVSSPFEAPPRRPPRMSTSTEVTEPSILLPTTMAKKRVVQREQQPLSAILLAMVIEIYGLIFANMYNLF
jgi:hypothetical protein